MVTTVSEEFYQSIVPQPELKSLDNLGLSLQGPDGKALPYIGYIEARIEISFHAAAVDIPVLAVPSTEYNTHVPVIVGTNLIRIARENSSEEKIPQAWQDAFLSLQNAFVGLVKSTNKKEFEIRPLETVTVSGFVRKNKSIETAVTETSEKASRKIGVCPRVVV